MPWQDCSQSPGEVSAQKDAARRIRQQEEDLQKLQDRVSVLAHAKETDGRRFKQIAVERQREREELKREVERLKVSHQVCCACACALVSHPPACSSGGLWLQAMRLTLISDCVVTQSCYSSV